MDPVTGVLKRDGAASKMNPYDLYALETAFRIREQTGGTVQVISMASQQAKQVIREAFAMGADAGRLSSYCKLQEQMCWLRVIRWHRGSKRAASSI
ncbi:MAG: hypothetical protein V8R43_05960 [Dorea sp.]